MKQLTKLILSAFTISFLGSLPLGTLNITITNLSIQQGYFNTVMFALGAILVEIIIVKISISFTIQLEKIKNLLKIFNWLSIILLFSLAIIFFMYAIKKIPSDTYPAIKLNNLILWGAFLSFLNPLQLPFWIAWTSILKSKELLPKHLIHQIAYFIAIALGTGFAYYLYIEIGSGLIHFFKNQSYLINFIIGVSLLFTGLIQLLKISKNKYT
ncbi:MAG TPA: LysE family transporter [Sediminibacterium sp.]|uniref:LysE family transporter n=1 Tax=Sediminibacterium sp. TaxID=1917865 RepID=UPI0008BFDF9C|nr:LysE family transporter [Sediminibacterium sp.]OHC85864.1 MAG: hypothetical protein A2472_09020 [Sphingobacteriia bacterium RIFOXYC2_FULL_35_18]OHC87399.1 MAG: hypothetical protein A2546_05175 [Sphingobacteriia bacterium RIFOXYD2_FULL_35_12]HLD52475.1 LysE family transporter [Sediminibacterium sp.]